MNGRTRTAFSVVALALASQGPAMAAESIPATLPRPDGKPADLTKKVKVYILAGQSNMVGFGLLRGATLSIRASSCRPIRRSCPA